MQIVAHISLDASLVAEKWRPLYRPIRAWKDWQTRPENSFRNYDVIEIIPRALIRPGTTFWYRSYLVVGAKKQAVELSKKLVPHVDYGLLEFDEKVTIPAIQINLNNSFLNGIFFLFETPILIEANLIRRHLINHTLIIDLLTSIHHNEG